ncbi:hypothetical protein BEN71_09670 [Acinetobacter wuhouensis]|uniref:DUF7710 domain-containing protein n=1 Tax=Acinetobacter wuhouensis TaxID=1879050 RepID=UPI00083AE715|nr:hypothetical protein [Acinetobacter wuhouensis]AXQ22324.1 hypothetical protein BEN71_09670 [Acinetobacter wuhouensis]
MNHSQVYLFKADNAVFASAIFSSFKAAQKWIYDNSLTGLLIEYPLNISTYDWAIKKGYFKVKHMIDISPIFIGSFVSAYQVQWHFRHGKFDHQFSREILKNYSAN